MKRALAALAVLVVSSIGTLARAADGDMPVVKGNIEIYGAAKVSVDIITTDAKSAGADKGLTNVSSNSSRIGFRGAESFSDDLNGIMQLELGVNYDGTQTSVASSGSYTKSTSIDKITYRNSFVGISSKMAGNLIFGIHDTPYKMSTGTLDLFADTMADYNAIIGTVNGTADFDQRTKDSVMYQSPKFSGIQVMAATSSTGQESANSSSGSKQEYSLSVTYSGGPFYVSIADEVHKNGFASLDSSGKKLEGTKLGVGFTWEGTRASFVYEALKDEVADSKNTRNAMYIGASQKLGNETVKVAYGMADDGKDTSTKTGATFYALGAEHQFSKRTTAYLLYAKTANDADATYGFGQSGAGGSYKPSKGEKPSVISFGMNHSF